MTRRSVLLWAALVLVVLAASNAAAELATETEATMVAGNWATHIVRTTGDWGGSDRPTVSGVTRSIIVNS